MNVTRKNLMLVGLLAMGSPMASAFAAAPPPIPAPPVTTEECSGVAGTVSVTTYADGSCTITATPPPGSGLETITISGSTAADCEDRTEKMCDIIDPLVAPAPTNGLGGIGSAL